MADENRRLEDDDLKMFNPCHGIARISSAKSAPCEPIARWDAGDVNGVAEFPRLSGIGLDVDGDADGFSDVEVPVGLEMVDVVFPA